MSLKTKNFLFERSEFKFFARTNYVFIIKIYSGESFLVTFWRPKSNKEIILISILLKHNPIYRHFARSTNKQFEMGHADRIQHNQL